MITGAAITESLAPKAPKVPSPFDFADPDRRQEKFAITRFTDPSSYTGTNFSTGSSGDGSTYGSFVGNLDVTKMQGDVSANFGTINKSLSYAMGMQGMAPFISAGGAISKFNLERIYNKVQAGEGGHGIAMLGGNIVGVSPGLFGGYVLSGMIPEGLTSKQRQQIIDNILNTNAVTPDTLPPGSPSPDDNDDPVFDDDGYSGVGPSPDEGGSIGDPGYYPPDPPPPAASPPPYTGRPDDSQTGGEDSDHDTPSDNVSDFDTGLSHALGGRVGLKGGGAAGKAPSTGFIDGPPQNYSKGMTVADTEDMKVRVGSFIINAPTTERLQKEGKLPKGPQKRKAAKGGKMMDVALSKGEYLIDVADIEKFGGYDVLNAENDKGKAEVDRRQAAASGGFINGYQYGGSAGIKAGPLSTVELMKSGLNLTNPTPSSFMEFDSGDLAPYTVNGINVGNVQKALTLVETRGYQDRNEGYFFTRSDTTGKESSAFGPLQITKDTLEGMVGDNFGELKLAFKTEPGLKEYYDKMIVEGRNAVNVRKYKDIYVGPEGSAKRTYASEKEKAKYKGLGYGNIPVDEHKKHYPTLAALYMRYKAGMSKSEEDLVIKHFGNKKSLKKYQDAKKELGIK